MNRLVCHVASLAIIITPLPTTASAQIAKTSPSSSEQVLRLRREAKAAYTAGDYSRGEKAAAQVVELVRQSVGDNSKDFASALNEHAAMLLALGHPAEAEPLFRRSFAIFTEQLGNKHIYTISSLGNLASNLFLLGRFVEAEPLFRRELALSTEVLGENHPNTISSLDNLASNLDAIGHSAEAELLHRRALALRIKMLGEKHPDTISTLNNLASTLDTLGRPTEAEPLFRRALNLSIDILGEDHPDTITSIDNLAMNLKALGRLSEAEPLVRRALALRIKVLGEKHPNSIASVNNLASTLDSLGRSDEAEPLYRRAWTLETEVMGEKHPDTLGSLNNLASYLYGKGQIKEAESLHRRGLVLSSEVLGEKHPNTITLLNNLAWDLNALGRSAEAESLFRRVLVLRTQVLGEKHPDTVISLGNLASVLLKLPDEAARAEPFALRAATLIRARTAEFGASERDAAQVERQVKSSADFMALLANAEWAAAKARPTKLSAFRGRAFQALQDVTAGSVTQAVALTAARRAAEASGEVIGALARERQTLSERWRLNDAAQTAAFAGGPGGVERLTMLRGEQTAIEAGIAAADARLRKEAPGYFALIRPAALSLADAQRLLAPDEAVLMVIPTGFGTHVMALTREGLAWTRTAMTAPEVASTVAVLRRDLDPQNEAPTRAAYDRSTAYTLFRATVEPVMAAIAGKTYLYVAADGALASLPFGALVAAAPQGDDADPAALRATDWLADRFALVQLPSLQSLAFLRQFRARPATKTETGGFSGFGDPALGGRSQPKTVAALLGSGETATRGGIADVAKLSDLAPLPGTAVELDALRRALGAEQSSVHTRGSATEAAVRAADLSHVRVLAFATHGLMAGEGGLAEPALVLTPPKVVNVETGEDGLLTASEVTALKLDADWVILSACNTAAGAGGGEPGLSGLARSFFYAGARSLLASHWRVRDDVAPMLVVEAVRLQRNNPGVSRAQALQRAARAVRNDEADPTLAHPRAWAPFSLIGDKG